MSRKQTPLCLLCTIVERGGGQRAFRTYEKHGIALHYRISGEGTASSDLLDLLGFGTSERDILISPARRSAVDALVEEIHRDGSHMRAKGILFVLPLTAASAKIAGALLGAHISNAEEGTAMEQNAKKQSMILVAVNQGYTEAVMATAKAAGRPGRHRNPQPHPAQRRTRLLRRPPRSPANANCWSSWPPARASATPSWKASTKPHGGESAAHAILYSMPIEQMVTFPETKRQGEPKRFPPFLFSLLPPPLRDVKSPSLVNSCQKGSIRFVENRLGKNAQNQLTERRIYSIL